MASLWVMGASALTGILGLWVGYTALYEGRLDSPKYKVLKKEKAFELREYEPFAVASTVLQAQGEGQLSAGFRILARFIFGGNSSGESLAMTAPVIQQNGLGSGLLAPASDAGMTMAFVMPIERQLSSIPQPNNSAVDVQAVSWAQVASYRFSGRASQADFQKAELRLREWLDSHQLSPKGAAAYAQYNSPSAFPALRRNEVLIQISPLNL